MAIQSERTPAGSPSSAVGVAAFREDPLAAYEAVRAATTSACAPMEIDDYGLQSMPDCSPAKWHLAHTTWFFETFVLAPACSDYEVFHEQFGYLFNSYYEAVGSRHPRPRRGLLSRPTVAEVYRYREHVDAFMRKAIGGLDPQRLAVLELGLHHEQQHQELIYTDLKHGLSCNTLRPAYRTGRTWEPGPEAPPLTWSEHPGGVARIGHTGDGFHFDNEGPSHRVFHEPFALANRMVTCGEYLEFMADGGYERPDLWLYNGWAQIREHGWRAPLYWEERDGQWWVFTLDGMRPVDPNEPVCHVSLYEADAYASWTSYRLPTEFEWETRFKPQAVEGNFVESTALHPRAAGPGELAQGFGDAWEWTMSAYAPYPAYRAPAGALGEYNGKFMCSQNVLRGGSCVTPAQHARATYRNFFYPADRWQFTGIRLARDL